MNVKKKLKYDYSSWEMTPTTDISKPQLIKKIHEDGYEFRADFIAKSFRQMAYVVDYFAQSQQDVDDLMTLAVFAVDRAINTLVRRYQEENQLLDETQIHYILHYTLLRVIQREIKQKEERFSKLVSWEDVAEKEHRSKEPSIDDYLDWEEQFVDDNELFNRKELILYAHKLIKATKKKLKSVHYFEDILKDYFMVEPKEFKEIMDMVELLSAPKQPTMIELAEKYNVCDSEIRRRIVKVLHVLRRESMKSFSKETKNIIDW